TGAMTGWAAPVGAAPMPGFAKSGTGTAPGNGVISPASRGNIMAAGCAAGATAGAAPLPVAGGFGGAGPTFGGSCTCGCLRADAVALFACWVAAGLVVAGCVVEAPRATGAVRCGAAPRRPTAAFNSSRAH